MPLYFISRCVRYKLSLPFSISYQHAKACALHCVLMHKMYAILLKFMHKKNPSLTSGQVLAQKLQTLVWVKVMFGSCLVMFPLNPPSLLVWSFLLLLCWCHTAIKTTDPGMLSSLPTLPAYMMDVTMSFLNASNWIIPGTHQNNIMICWFNILHNRWNIKLPTRFSKL